MQKKLLSFFTLLVVLCMGTTAKAATPNTQSDEEESPVMPFEEYLVQREIQELHVVTTAAEFLNHWKQNHRIAIAADIDLSSFTKSDHQIDTFTGELCSYDPKGVKRYKLTNIPETMAQHMTNAYIHDICFEDSRPKWDVGVIDNARGTSLVARYGKNCRVENVAFRNVHVVGKDIIDNSSYGAIIFSHDEGSTFIDIEAYECTVYINSNYAAILCAKSEGSNFYRCLVMTTCAVYSNGSYANDGYAGAIAGYAKDAKFTECNSLCSVSSGKDGIGGIVGHGENCTFNLCNNYGCVTQKTIGGAEALENAAKQMGAMTVTGSKSFDQLVAAGQDNGMGSLYALTNQVEAFTSINLLESSMAQAYEDWLIKVAGGQVYKDALEQEFAQMRWGIIDKLCNEEQLDLSFVQENYTDQLSVRNLIDRCPEANELINPTKPTKVAHGRAISNVLRGLGIALSAYQIWSQIYDELDSDEVGGIVGYLDGGSISGCSNYGLVYCTDVSSGGIVGEAHNVNITNCLNQGLVQGYGKTGGIVGLIEGGSLKTSLNVGNVSNGNSSNDSFGRIYGQASGATISHNFFSGNVDRSSEDAQVAEVPLKMLATGEVAMKLNQHAGGNMWRQSLGLDYYPNLAPANDMVKASNPDISPTIRTKYASDFLLGIMNQYTNIELEGDIELNTSLANFSSRLMPFQGSINGHGHRLKNLTYVANYNEKSNWWWSNDNANKNVGLFSFARNATFKDLELCDFNVIVAELTDTCGLLVGNSTNCTYENIHITGHSSIQDNKPTYRVGALVGSSKNDTFTGCTTGALCQIGGATSMLPYDEDVEVGGLVGVAVGSDFTNCINRAEVNCDNDKAGGIVGNSKDGKIERCLNMGTVQGSEHVGGMVGFANNTLIHQCANTGLIDCNATLQESEVGGIVGEYIRMGGGGIYECANWGNVHRSAGDDQGAIHGIYKKEYYGSQWVHDNYYCFRTEDNDLMSNVDESELLSGKWAYDYNSSHSDSYYQDIDNNLFGTHYPVPVEEAGMLYHIRNCKEADSWKYTNRYITSIPHEKTLDKFGVCSKCGDVYEAPQDIEILDGFDLVDLAYANNNGQNFANSTIHVERDIDMSLVDRINNHNPIGTREHPFSGTFDGNYHTIKNLNIDGSYAEPGLFGAINGTTTIKNLILDPTCAIRSMSWGAGGFVGCTSGSVNANLINLGFEGFVSGNKNVAAILGGTFSVEGASIEVRIDHCYSTGTVKGDTESAALCGYASGNFTVNSSWNAGKVTGYSQDQPTVRGNYISSGCYDVNATDEARHISADDMTSGNLAFRLNGFRSGWGNGESGEKTAWYQQIGVEERPTFFRNTDHLVFRHDYIWCDDPETYLFYFENKRDSIPARVVKHEYDDKGICTLTSSEVHGEECPVVDNCWKVTKIGHLYNIAEQVNSGKEQHDINLQADLTDNCAVIAHGALNPESASFRQWTPIGTYDHPFTQVFKGNKHTISGLYENPDQRVSYAGLFGEATGDAVIKEVGIIDSYFDNALCTGAIAASFYTTSADVNHSPRIINCYSSDGITMTQGQGGGILGIYTIEAGNDVPDDFDPIRYCYNTSTVVPYSGSTGKAGGILGQVVGANNSKITSNCYYLEGCTTGTSGHGEAKSELAFRLGEVCQLLDQGQGLWSQPIYIQQEPYFGSDGVTYARNVTAGNWGSLILPFPVTSDEKVQYYTYKNITIGGYDLENGELHLQKVDEVPANTPCFFRTSADCSELSLAAANSVVTPSSSEVKTKVGTQVSTSLYLVGSYDNITVERLAGLEDNYFVAQNKLWWGERAFNLGAFRSYVKLTDSKNGVKSLTFVVDDDETGIKPISPLESKGAVKLLENGKIVILKNGVKYNAAGQRIL